MPQDVSISHVKETFEDWSMYEAVIRHNYMCHHELAGGLKAIAAGVAGGWLARAAVADAERPSTDRSPRPTPAATGRAQ